METASLSELRVGEFLDRLASDRPTPGGGSVAALVGASGAALGRMAAALTLGKPRFADVAERVAHCARRLERIDRLFRRLMDEDAAAYGELHAAFRLPKNAPQRAVRIAQTAGLAACVPLETVAVARQSLTELEKLARIGNPNLRSDMEAAVSVTKAAMRAAAANVRANLPLVGEQESHRIETELRKLLE